MTLVEKHNQKYEKKQDGFVMADEDLWRHTITLNEQKGNKTSSYTTIITASSKQKEQKIIKSMFLFLA